MDKWKLGFALLLLLTSCMDNKAGTEILMKVIDKQPDVTPICSNETLNVIMLIVCKISTQVRRGAGCSLLYRHGQNFKHECDSRFTLTTENQTVFLHLTNLTPEDSGNYTCECVHTGGTYKLHLSVTVEGTESHKVTTSPTEIPFSLSFCVLIGVLVVLIISGVILGFIYERKCSSRTRQVPITNPEIITDLGNTEAYMTAGEIEPYSIFMQKENGLYLTSKINTNHIT
ncbi:adenylosuccinate lyase [Sarotherodon galilaeus]